MLWSSLIYSYTYSYTLIYSYTRISRIHQTETVDMVLHQHRKLKFQNHSYVILTRQQFLCVLFNENGAGNKHNSKKVGAISCAEGLRIVLILHYSETLLVELTLSFQDVNYIILSLAFPSLFLILLFWRF